MLFVLRMNFQELKQSGCLLNILTNVYVAIPIEYVYTAWELIILLIRYIFIFLVILVLIFPLKDIMKIFSLVYVISQIIFKVLEF